MRASARQRRLQTTLEPLGLGFPNVIDLKLLFYIEIPGCMWACIPQTITKCLWKYLHCYKWWIHIYIYIYIYIFYYCLMFHFFKWWLISTELIIWPKDWSSLTVWKTALLVGMPAGQLVPPFPHSFPSLFISILPNLTSAAHWSSRVKVWVTGRWHISVEGSI